MKKYQMKRSLIIYCLLLTSYASSTWCNATTPTVYAKVVDSADGSPIRSFQIGYNKGIPKENSYWETKVELNVGSTAYYPDPPHFLQKFSENGVFAISNLDNYPITVFISSDGYAMKRVVMEPHLEWRAELEHEIELVRQKAVVLRVTDPSGQSLSDALVFIGPIPEIMSGKYSSNPFCTVSDETGEATFKSFPESERMLTVWHDKYAPFGIEIPPPESIDVPILVKLEPQSTVVGYIESNRVNELEGHLVAVSFRLPSGRTYFHTFSRTGKAGSFVFEGLPPGSANFLLTLNIEQAINRVNQFEKVLELLPGKSSHVTFSVE